jgi:hypothetical protein
MSARLVEGKALPDNNNNNNNNNVTGKGTVVPVHATKTYTGRRGIAPLTLTHGIRCKLVVSITSRSFYSRIITAVAVE